MFQYPNARVIHPVMRALPAKTAATADSGRRRSRFRTDGDHRSEVTSITIPAGWRSVFDRRIGIVIDMSSG